jgi:hypothetical protein
MRWREEMLRIFFVVLCHTALLVALTDDWVAAQTANRRDAEAAAADNDLLCDQLMACQIARWHTGAVQANDLSKRFSILDSESPATLLTLRASSERDPNQFLSCHMILQC